MSASFRIRRPAVRLRATAGRRRGRSALSRYLFVAPAIIFLLVFMFYPIAYTFNLSLFDVNVGNFLKGGAAFVGFDNYVEFLSSPGFLSSLLVTLVFTLASLAFQHLIGWAFALFFNRKFPLSGFLRAIMLVVWVMPAVVSASLWRWMYSGSYGLFNSILDVFGIHTDEAWLVNPQTALIAVIITNIWLGIPFHMMLVYAGLQGVPHEVYEAASLDGASARQRLFGITVPLMRPVVAIALLLGFVHTFKVFDVIYVMTAGGPAGATNVLSIAVYNLSFEYFRLGDGAAAANILLVIPLIVSVVYLLVRRREESA
ncbi:MAG: sugar ABC transporter permease [Pseudolysinimonas sp.]|uniref:carbohydrate ABC transporter permease n=1 Tax=Pseudolysinimonas sp. TaxID=2680009 RepID=UPI0032678BD8